MGRRSRRTRATATAQSGATALAVAERPPRARTNPTSVPEVIDARDYMYEVVANLARSSFAAVSNPRRRRLRRGDGGYHCDYRTVEELRNISRWLEYHSGSYAGALHNWSQYLVGAGPAWVPATADVEWNRKAAELIQEDLKEKRHDVRRRFSWGKWLKLLGTSIVRDGAMGVAHTPTGAAQLIEAERVVAVNTDAHGRVVDYRVANLRNGFLDYSTKQPYYPSQFDWCAVVTRVSQDLGVPLCFSSLDDHDGISDLWQAEIDSATESARPWVIIKHKDGALAGGMTIPTALGNANNSQAVQSPTPGRGDTPAGYVRTPNGNMMGLPPGLDAVAHQPDRPNLDVPQFTKDVLRMACMMLLPYELLFGDQANINYSNGRSIRKLGNGLLSCFRTDYLEPPATRVVHGLLRQRILRGDIGLPKDERKDAWKLGKFKWDEIAEHDRIKERQADTIDLQNGTATLKKLVGEDWQANLEQQGIESITRSRIAASNIEEIQKICNKLNKRTPGLNLSWSHIVTIAGAASAPGAYLQAATGAVAEAKDPEGEPANKSEPSNENTDNDEETETDEPANQPAASS